MRRVLLGMLALGLMGAGEPAAPPMDSKERAYTIALICVVIAANDNDQAGGVRSLDAVRKMGKAKGYTNKRVSDDIGTMANVVGVQLRGEPATVVRNRSICRQLGLIG